MRAFGATEGSGFIEGASDRLQERQDVLGQSDHVTSWPDWHIERNEVVGHHGDDIAAFGGKRWAA